MLKKFCQTNKTWTHRRDEFSNVVQRTEKCFIVQKRVLMIELILFHLGEVANQEVIEIFVKKMHGT